jgi:branched-chain amino acid transport system permease protein
MPGVTARKSLGGLWNVVPFIIFLVAYALLPRYAKESQLTTLIYIGIYALLAVGLNLLMGYAGQISLGHAAFFGMGAFASGILTVKPIPGEVIPGFSVGVGLMAGAATLMSLARVTGWKLAAGVVVLLLLSWLARALPANPVVPVIVFGAVMAGCGRAVKVDWRKAGTAGVVAAFVTALSRWFLEGTLARGGTSPWTGMIVGVFLTGLVAYLIGGQVLRLKGHYLAMATLAFGIIVEIVFRQWTAVTGGSSDGIFSIPTIQYFDSIPGFARRAYEAAAGGVVGMRVQYYYLVWGFVFLALVLAVNIVRSRVGRAFRAVHGSEPAAASLGVDTERYKVQVFVLSAALASIAGSLHAHNAGIGYINPSEFSFMVSVQLVVMVVLGGMASVWGSMFGAGAIQMLKNWMLDLDKAHHQFLGLTLKGLDPIVFGAVLIVVMIVLPQGLVRGVGDGLSAVWRMITRSRREE